VAEMYGEYRPLFEGVGTGPGDSTLEDKLYEYEVIPHYTRLLMYINDEGKNKFECLYDAISIWFILFLVEIKRARMSKCCLDCRMHRAKT